MDVYNSGAGSQWENNFKNMYVMKGAIKNPDPNAEKQFDIAISNFVDGISADEYSLLAASLAAGPYSRAKKTEIGGYWEKLFVKGLEHLSIQFDEDCHTKKYKTVELTEKNIDIWMYSNIIEGNQLVELNPSNMNKYIGKTLKFRFSGFCECDHGICEACAGSLFRKLNLKNVGVVSYKLCSDLKNLAMKNFHDSVVRSSAMQDYGYRKIFGL
jgi:hypothetical protein